MNDEEKLIKQIILSLVDEKDKVKVSATVTAHTAVFDIKVANKDVGKVLGKKGVYADALRTIFGAIYGRAGKKLHLQVYVEPKADAEIKEEK